MGPAVPDSGQRLKRLVAAGLARKLGVARHLAEGVEVSRHVWRETRTLRGALGRWTTRSRTGGLLSRGHLTVGVLVDREQPRRACDECRDE